MISDEQVVNDFINLYPDKHFNKTLKLKYYLLDNPNYDEFTLFWDYIEEQSLLTYDEIYKDYKEIIEDVDLINYCFIKENIHLFKNNISDIKKSWIKQIYHLHKIVKFYKFR
ncbi:hypothetical protein RRG39_02280 [Mycoplasmopsis cynos]|uniref:hypothetical protein n=1 Tax=Mycoplasmopsis cynos TaxID=171284 RepID=UPI002AFF248B|nr:hypothetical protein [Mycoplasmopsis cynos]WQQ16590.1 hypothetical protein RRG39_02280 [Mycoplasmopsis cynos]